MDTNPTANSGSKSKKGDQKQDDSKESIFLKDILGDQMTINDFFQNVWQQRSMVFPFLEGRPSNNIFYDSNNSWNDENMQTSPRKELVNRGWTILTEILHQSQREQEKLHAAAAVASAGNNVPHIIDTKAEEHQRPILFRNLEVQSREEVDELYGSSTFGPYLNGCSIVLNHGDLLSPWIAAICNDLQATFPHAYANCYLTPPNSQAVPAHADDRDVLVVQLVGSKNWTVYKSVPVPYPYPHEQVGKDGIPVPPQVLNGPIDISTTLQPGDVLYMPRGLVHEAQCSPNSLSFHMTIALATHDWTLAGMMIMATQSIFSSIIDYRKSILPIRDISNDSKALQTQIDEAFERAKQEVTAEAVLGNLRSRLENHNRRAFPLRMELIHKARFPPSQQQQPESQENGNSNKKLLQFAGPLAAEKVTLETIVRAATKDERSRVDEAAATAANNNNNRPRGLNVREEIADSIISIVSTIKANPGMKCRVRDFPSLMPSPNPLVCDLALLCLAKQSVELGALVIVHES